MACDASTLAALAAANKLSGLSERELLICLAYIYGVAAGYNATTATSAAASSGLAKLSERDLWAVIETVLC